jgi:hypothetical protein
MRPQLQAFTYFRRPQFIVPWLAIQIADHEWLAATHRTRYSTPSSDFTEQLAESTTGSDYQQRKRPSGAPTYWSSPGTLELQRRGFNPGGNHGSFLRDSTTQS